MCLPPRRVFALGFVWLAAGPSNPPLSPVSVQGTFGGPVRAGGPNRWRTLAWTSTRASRAPVRRVL